MQVYPVKSQSSRFYHAICLHCSNWIEKGSFVMVQSIRVHMETQEAVFHVDCVMGVLQKNGLWPSDADIQRQFFALRDRIVKTGEAFSV